MRYWLLFTLVHFSTLCQHFAILQQLLEVRSKSFNMPSTTFGSTPKTHPDAFNDFWWCTENSSRCLQRLLVVHRKLIPLPSTTFGGTPKTHPDAFNDFWWYTENSSRCLQFTYNTEAILFLSRLNLNANHSWVRKINTSALSNCHIEVCIEITSKILLF